MEINSTTSSSSLSFSSSSNSSTKMSSKSFLKPSRVIQKKKSSSVTKILKHYIAPLPKLPHKIYKVEPKDFMTTVQKLTGPQPESDHQPIRRLKDLAPPPLNLSPIVPTIFIPDDDDENDTELMGQVVEFDSEMDEYLKNLESLIKISPNKLMTPSCGSITGLGGLLSPLVTPSSLSLSPASLSWCSLFLSPGTLSTLDQSILLAP